MKPVRQVARVLSRQPAPPVRLRQGVITAVNANRTVTITVAGATLTSVPCLTSGVPVAGDAVLVVVCGRDMFVLGSVADATTVGYTPLMQHGSLNIGLGGAITAFTAVTFDWAFPSTPDIVTGVTRGLISNDNYIASVNGAASTGFNARVKNVDGNLRTENATFYWAAFHNGR